MRLEGERLVHGQSQVVDVDSLEPLSFYGDGIRSGSDGGEPEDALVIGGGLAGDSGLRILQGDLSAADKLLAWVTDYSADTGCLRSQH